MSLKLISRRLGWFTGAAVFALTLSPQAARAQYGQAAPGVTFTTVAAPGATNPDREFPIGGLVEDSAGNLYGTTSGDEDLEEQIVVFKLTPSGAFQNFSSLLDEVETVSSLTIGPGDILYGTGVYGYPSIYSVDSTGKVSDLYYFGGQYGSLPESSLVPAGDGSSFYGLTSVGGPDNDGMIYQFTPPSTVVTLHSFSGADGANPMQGLVIGADDALYGTTNAGGASDDGTVFRFGLDDQKLTTLYTFTGGADGSAPGGGLVLGGDGNLYGVASAGGANGAGTAYQVKPAGGFDLLHTFGAVAKGKHGHSDHNNDGSFPGYPLIAGTDGNLYGTAPAGGLNGSGTVFQLTKAGAFTTVYAFPEDLASRNNELPQNDNYGGAMPLCALLEYGDGVLYGTTYIGDAANGGTIFSVAVPGLATVVPESIAVEPSRICGGNAHANGLVTLRVPALAGGAAVSLTSSDPAAASVPPTITVSPGGTTATFRVNAPSVAADTPVTITASYGGESKAASLTVTPPEAGQIKLATNIVEGGAVIPGNRIYLTGNATSDMTLPLYVNIPAAIVVPKSETILAGTNSHSFTLSADPVTKESIQIVSTSSSYGNASQLIILEPGLTAVTLGNSSVKGGQTLAGNAARLAGYTEYYPITVSLASSNPTVATVPASVVVKANDQSAKFSINTSSVTAPTKVTITATSQGIVRTVTLTVNP